MPDTPYQLAQQFRAALLKRDADALRDITAAYNWLVTSLQLSVSTLGASVTRARATGQTINATWLFRERRLQLLLAQAEQQLATFTAQATRQITNDQRAAVTLAQDHANQLLSAADAEFTFTRLPTAAIETLIGFSGDGAPLHQLLAKIPGDAVGKIRATLIAAIATGQSPRQTATQIKEALDGNLARANTISRTTVMQSYRFASLQHYQQNAHLVRSYQWLAAKSPRTCLNCLARDSSIWPLNTPMPVHVNCRCTLIPITGEPIKRQTGTEWFESQPESVKKEMLGELAYQYYARGLVRLSDFAGYKISPSWGAYSYQRSLKEILGHDPRRKEAIR